MPIILVNFNKISSKLALKIFNFNIKTIIEIVNIVYIIRL
jgi:hypothetical protein